MIELHERASVWRCGAKVFEIDRLHPLIMGILNVTPDSFSDGGTHNGLEDAVAWRTACATKGAHHRRGRRVHASGLQRNRRHA